MTASVVAFTSAVPAQPTEPAVETLHLRQLIERQPACVLRVGIDGLLLAVNEAALRLLGAEELSRVLGTKLTKLIIPEHHEQWDDVVTRVRDGGSGSVECDLTDLAGMRRTVLLQAVPLLDHADGIPSMILAARDTSTPRRLEKALREREVSRELDDLQTQLAQRVAEGQRDATALGPREVQNQRTAAEHATELAQLRQTLIGEHQLDLLLAEQEGRRRLDNQRSELEQTRRELEQALAERQRLATLLDEREDHHQRVIAEHAGELAAELAKLRQTLAEEHQLALLLKEQEGRRRLDGQRSELEQGRAEVEQALAAAVKKEAEIKKALADQRVALQSVDENARNLEWLAAAGRTALAVGRELETTMAAVDARAEHLLAQTSLEADNRHVIEALRSDAIGAALLARQIVQASTDSAKAGTTPLGPSGDAGKQL